MNKLQQLMKRLEQHKENSSQGPTELLLILREGFEELVRLELERNK